MGRFLVIEIIFENGKAGKFKIHSGSESKRDAIRSARYERVKGSLMVVLDREGLTQV